MKQVSKLFFVVAFTVSLSTFASAETGRLKFFEPKPGFGYILADQPVRFHGNEFLFAATGIANYRAFLSTLSSTNEEDVCVSFELDKQKHSFDLEAVNVSVIPCK